VVDGALTLPMLSVELLQYDNAPNVFHELSDIQQVGLFEIEASRVLVWGSLTIHLMHFCTKRLSTIWKNYLGCH
jgi:hypothetical protein